MSNQTKVLRLASQLEKYWGAESGHDRERQAAAELRRLHAVNQELLDAAHTAAAMPCVDDDECGYCFSCKARAAIARAEGGQE